MYGISMIMSIYEYLYWETNEQDHEMPVNIAGAESNINPAIIGWVFSIHRI